MVCVQLDLGRQEVWQLVQIVCTQELSFEEFFFLSQYLFHCFVRQKMSIPHSNLFSEFSHCFLSSQFLGLDSTLYSLVNLPLYCFE